MQHPSDPLNAFVAGPEGADLPEKSGPLSGLTLAVKDIYAVKGQRTGGGNPHMLAEAQPATATAPSVAALLDAGARFAGRTQTDELTFSLMGHNAHYPQPVNPAAPDRVTGGSSSGSAAAVAGGLVDIATASDTGGSVRAPASFCGLLGLRTTHGRISLEGAMPLAPSFDTFGWFAKDAETYEKVGRIFFGEAGDAPHPYPLPAGGERGSPAPRSPGQEGLALPSTSPSPRTSRGEGKGEGRRNAVRLAALDALIRPEAEAEYCRMAAVAETVTGTARAASPLTHSLDDLYWAFRKLQAHEAWAAHGPFLSAGDRGLGPGVKERFEFGRAVTADEVKQATALRTAFRAELADLLGDDGLLVLPTVPGAAPLRTAGFDDQQAFRERALRLLCLSGLSGFPQITIPLGKVDGAPFGLSLIGPANSDMPLIRLARTIIEVRR